MDRVELAVESRALVGKRVKQLRKQGKVPAVMYGHGFEPVPLQTDAKTLGRLLMHVGGSQLINLQITDQGQSEMALVRDVQRDVLTRNVTHVDFYRVRMTERLKTEIPLEIVGESPVVKDKQGLLLQGISSIEVECLPGDLVDAIRVDVSSLVRVDMSIFVRDLDVPSGIDVLTDADEMIARIVYIAEEEAIEGAEAALPEVAEVEVIRRGKEEEEELPSE
ncbi:MAG: 50S ribosomal protein L25 [Anaerolineales bacterium]|nr:50S ribosomal protein L25 [Anaerolineales bacterium]